MGLRWYQIRFQVGSKHPGVVLGMFGGGMGAHDID